MGKRNTDVLGKSISNKWFTVGGIAIGIASTLVNNSIENNSNVEEKDLYMQMIHEINEARKSKGHINIQADSI